MSEDIILTATLREPGHPRHLRHEGHVPVVLYGRDVDNLHLKVSESELDRIMTLGGMRGLLHLEVKDLDDAERVVMVREIQRDPVERNVLHLDLYQVDLTSKLTTSVPIVLTGEEAATSGIGVLQHGVRELEVECLPADIPDNLTVDIAHLELGDSITVADIEAPEDVDILNDPTDTVVTLVQPKLEVEEPEDEDEEILDLEEEERREPEVIGEEDEPEEDEPRA